MARQEGRIQLYFRLQRAGLGAGGYFTKSLPLKIVELHLSGPGHDIHISKSRTNRWQFNNYRAGIEVVFKEPNSDFASWIHIMYFIFVVKRFNNCLQG